jgi:glutathione peroxidase
MRMFHRWAAEARPRDAPHWSLHKYLIGGDGCIAETFPETVEPSDTRIKTAIARVLADS